MRAGFVYDAGVLAATVQASKAAGQTSKAAKPGGDAAQSAAAPAAATPAAAAPTASGRPFCQVSWQLEASSAVGVAQLGWTPADQDALVTSNSATAGPAAPGAAAATTPAAAAPGKLTQRPSWLRCAINLKHSMGQLGFGSQELRASCIQSSSPKQGKV